MTTFAERVFGRSFGRQPEIEDGVRGEALVLQSIAGLTPSLMNMDQRIVGGWNGWACAIPLLVRLPGHEPYSAYPVRWMSRSKFPIGGTTLPVTVERTDPSSIRIDWDEVPEIDEWIAAGHPVFTDPDSVQARYDEGWRIHRAEAVDDASRGVAEQVAKAAGATTGTDAERVRQLIADLQAEHAASAPQPTLKRPRIEGPSGRIIAVGRQEGNASTSRGEALLSVSVPGSSRYGVRVKTWVPASKVKLEWWDVPIKVDAKDPHKVKILWDEVAGIEVVTPLLREASERLEARLSAPLQTPGIDAYQGLLATIPDPERRAQAERQLAQGLRMAAGKAADPLEELERLGDQLAAGQLSEEEFAAEKARLLGEL